MEERCTGVLSLSVAGVISELCSALSRGIALYVRLKVSTPVEKLSMRRGAGSKFNPKSVSTNPKSDAKLFSSYGGTPAGANSFGTGMIISI